MNEIGKIYERPWGTYQTLALEAGFQIKILTVNAQGKLSLQRHQQRAEHWVVVKGTPTITIDDTEKNYSVNDAVYIPLKAKHRIQNFTDTICQLVEVQVGSYLGEDDIERFEDIYGRKVAGPGSRVSDPYLVPGT
ncbi:MAG TPA: phosphomannose isomerase type II C-terminal cupin domain [Coxiellaceae bacterium]|nr:phosphomannose isomerase type II C-terminal cupin domain [Coxiellaceae bacterium]